MKGIILAGGTGSRLRPSTISTSKQLFPIYDKPLIYYPLSTLMLGGIREILLITTPHDEDNFRKLFGDGHKLGMNIEYLTQFEPEGIAQAFLIGEKFIGADDVSLILGDNIFHGAGMGRELQKYQKPVGAEIFGYRVKNPQMYGVAEIDESGTITSIIEKPEKSRSNLAIPGLYFFDNSVTTKVKFIGKSQRGELEITDLLEMYRVEERLKLNLVARGTAWMDCGTINSLNDASNYIRVLEERQGSKVGAIEEIAWQNGWISISDLHQLAHSYGRNEYSEYLQGLGR